MTQEQFEAELKVLKWQEPFRPFVIERVDDEPVVVDDPNSLAFSGGYGGYMPRDGGVIDFSADEVVRLVPRSHQPTG